MSDSVLLRTAQASAIVTAAAAGGGIISISLFTIRSFLVKPRQRKDTEHKTLLGAPASHVARQWKWAYDVGKILFPSTALTSSLFFSYVAYTVRGDRGGRYLSGLYSTAAVLNVLIAPFTLLLIAPVNNAIWPYADRTDDLPVEGETLTTEEKLQRGQEEHQLVMSLKKLARLNIIRGLFPLLGASLGAAVSFGLV